MRESTSLLMAVADNGNSMSLHSWTATHPPSPKELALEKKRKQAMLVGLGFLLTCGIAVLVFLFFHPASILKHRMQNHHRHLLALEDSLGDSLASFKDSMASLAWLKLAGTDIVSAHEFFPNNEAQIRLNGGVIMDGHAKPLVDLDHIPQVIIMGDASQLYTLLLVDIGPSPSGTEENPEYLLWGVMNIPGGSSPSEGWEFVPYERSAKNVVKNALLVLFKQPSPLVTPVRTPSRLNFSSKEFASKLGLGNPKGAFSL